jgi:hypothetical protein
MKKNIALNIDGAQTSEQFFLFSYLISVFV